MNKAELIEAMVSRTGHSKKATAESLNAFISVVSEALKANDKVQLVGFGTFDVRKRSARKGRNPQTKEEIREQIREADQQISQAKQRIV